MPSFWILLFIYLFIFIINGCWILSKSFSETIEMIICFFIFPFVNMVHHTD